MKSKKLNILFSIAIILDILSLTGLFFIYGPIDYFRDLWITTAMSTKSHQYLAKVFYNDDTINEVMANNYMQLIDEDTDATEVKIGSEENSNTDYEKQILTRKEDQEYKIIPISGVNSLGTSYKGYVVAIYDPSRVKLALTENFGVIGTYLTKIAKENDAIVAINASGFLDDEEQGNGGTPAGTVIKDGKIVWEGKWSSVISGFNKDNVLVITNKSAGEAVKNGMRDGMEFGPALIVNGKSAKISGNGGYGIQPRTVLAQRKDGIVLFVVIDGRQIGYSVGIEMKGLIQILELFGAYNAVNMDGGASTTLVVNNELYNKPCGLGTGGQRWVPNAWIFK